MNTTSNINSQGAFFATENITILQALIYSMPTSGCTQSGSCSHNRQSHQCQCQEQPLAFFLMQNALVNLNFLTQARPYPSSVSICLLQSCTVIHALHQSTSPATTIHLVFVSASLSHHQANACTYSLQLTCFNKTPLQTTDVQPCDCRSLLVASSICIP